MFSYSYFFTFCIYLVGAIRKIKVKRRFWSLGLYGVKRITPKEARNVDIYLLKRKQKFTFQMKTEKQYATFAKSKTPKHHSLVISNFHPILLTCISIPSKLLEHITFSNVVGCGGP